MKFPALITFLSSALLLSSGLRAAEAPASMTTLPDVHHYVYLSELPDPAELTKDAAANGMTVTRVDRTADRLVVTYRYSNGTTGTVGYALLSAGQSVKPVAPRTVTRVTEVARVPAEPEVVYVERPVRTRVVYSDPVDDFWVPLTIGLGVGWIGGHYSGHHHYYGGGGRGGGWHGRGGWRR